MVQGPYLKATKTLLHRKLGDENVLIVKFEENAKGVSTFFPGNRNALYDQIAKEGILVGPRRYRFFGNFSLLPDFLFFVNLLFLNFLLYACMLLLESLAKVLVSIYVFETYSDTM